LNNLCSRVLNLDRPGKDVACDDCPVHSLTERDVRLILAEITATNQQVAGRSLNCSAILSPLDKSAVTETDCAPTCDFSDLITRTPERTITEPDDSAIGLHHLNHGGVIAMKRSKFAVCD
jgi:hypothetical protein